MRTPGRFKAETKYAESTEKKANVNLPAMAAVGNGDGATAADPNRDNFYWIRLINDDNRLTQCYCLLALSYDDLIYVAKAKDRKLGWYEFVSFVQDADGETEPPVCPKFAQVIYVSANGCHFTTLLDAVNHIKALPVGSRPAAGREFMIEIQAGTYTETGDIDLTAVTAITHTHIRGQGEATIVNMGDFCLTLNDDCSLESTIITGTGDNANWNLIYVLGDDVTLRELRAILTNWNTVIEADTVTGLEMYHVVLEATVATAYGFYFTGSVTALLWDCKADDPTNFDPALYVSGVNNTITTKFCEFHGDTYDVRILATNVWEHFCCQFDPDNSNIVGAETPLMHGRTNFDAVVAFEDGFTMDGASGANVVTFPDNVADALHFVDGTTGINFQQFVTTAGAQATIFNIGEIDVDFNIRAGGGISDPTDAFFLEGSTGRVFMGDLAPVYVGHVNIYDATINTAAPYYGFTNEHTKTAGVTDANDSMIGLISIMRVNQVGGTVGTFTGVWMEAELLAGTVGSGGSERDMTGFHMYLDLRGGTVTRDARAGFVDVDQQAANTVDRDLFGHRVDMDLAGTVTRDLYGLSFTIDTTIANTVGGDFYAAYFEIDLLGAVTGTTYMHFLQEDGNADFGYYQTTSAGVAGANYLEGKLTLTSAEIEFTAASNANLIEIPTAQAIGFKIVDTNAIEYWRIDTAPQLVSHFNQGGADIDTIFSASGVPNALVVEGSSGWIGNSNAPTYPLDFTYTDAVAGRRFLYVENIATNVAAGFFSQNAIYGWLEITHSGAGDLGLAGIQSYVAIRGAGDSALNDRDANVFRALARHYGTGTIDYFAGFALDMRNASTGTIVHLPALHVPSPLNTGGGVITHTYGLKIHNATVGGTNWGVHQLGSGMYNLFQGRVSVGGTVGALAQMHVDQSNAGGNIPVLLLDQADLSEEFIEFTTTVGAGNPIDTAAHGAYYGKARVMVTGVGYKVVALYEES